MDNQTKTADEAIRTSINETRIVVVPASAPMSAKLLEAADGTASAGDVTEYWGTARDGGEWRVHTVETPKNRAAVSLGRKGGKATSPAKAATAKANGAKGGRPSKPYTVERMFHGVREEAVVVSRHDLRSAADKAAVALADGMGDGWGVRVCERGEEVGVVQPGPDGNPGVWAPAGEGA